MPACGLRAQREAVATGILEAVHFLLDDVGKFTDRTPEELGVFDDRHAQFFIAVVAQQAAQHAIEMPPGGDLPGQHIVHATYGLE
jgi:hypothetical protein